MLPKTGRNVPVVNGDYAASIAAAIRYELGGTHQTIKTLMRWTGASERTVKNWLAEVRGPSAEHLIMLMKRSDAVLDVVLRMSGRDVSLVRELEAELIDVAEAIVQLVHRHR